MEITKQDKNLTKFLIPAFYLAAMVLVVLNVWNEQSTVRKGGDGPLYRNLMECPAWARRGFDAADITNVPLPGAEWVRFESPPLRISNSSLPDLPKRPYLSPWGREAEEFTIIIAVEMDDTAIEFLNGSLSVLPGIFLGYIGENWEIFFNGKMIHSEVHLDDNGRFDERRSWRDVYFQLDKSLIVQGTNILAMRILGDPTYDVTGLYYVAPYYLDDYRIIEKRQQNYLLLILCSISGFTGVYFLLLFLSVRRKREIFYLYYGIFSVLFCVYSFARNGVVNSFIPNSDISIRLEYVALFLMVTLLCFFVETIGRGKVTKISWGYLAFCLYISLTQIFFCTQYGDDVLKIWGVSILIYFSYVFCYSVVYFIFWSRSKNRESDTTMIHIMFGAILMYACGIFDVLDVLFFHKSFSLFIYSTFVVHFGLAITLLWRFNGMYKQLEQSNIMLETAVKERTIELENQTAIAVNASQAKREFLASMSHEIRTPLNAVIGLSEIELRKGNNTPGGLSESSLRNIAQIQQSSLFLMEIIGDILDISKIEEGKFELVPAEYDTAAMISTMVSINMIRLGSKPVNFVLDIDGGFPAKLIGDELRVKQILSNILSNAVKYTDEGTIQLTVKHDQKTNENILIRFTVRDTGMGIRTQDMEKLFESYTQLDSGVNRKTGGTGLGLPIAQNLTQMMGGAIFVESEYGKGSCFTVEIMQGIVNNGGKNVLCDYEQIGEETAENLRKFRYVSEWQDAAARSVVPPAKVLVVDDIPANLMVVCGLLSPYGLSVETAAGGAEAIAMVKAARYDIIFMDHMMPVADGIETAAAIRAMWKEQGEKSEEFAQETPIVAMTANAMRGMREYYLERGFDDYLSKPINAKELDKILVKWIGKEIRNEELGIRNEKTLSGSAAGWQHDHITNNNAIPNSSLLIPHSSFNMELAAQRLDMLDHYRVSFASGREIDSDYFKQFTALMRTFELNFAGLRPPGASGFELQEQAASLVTAGQREDAQTIREKLPAFCSAVENYQLTMSSEQNDNVINDLLPRMKRALLDGASLAEDTPEKIMAELRAAKLDLRGRELFFRLNDLLLEGETAKAAEAIDNYLGAVND